MFLLSALFLDGQQLTCEDTGDANDDGKIDLSDAVYILVYRFVGGPPPPAPFPEKGSDPTEDTLDCAKSF